MLNLLVDKDSENKATRPTACDKWHITNPLSSCFSVYLPTNFELAKIGQDLEAVWNLFQLFVKNVFHKRKNEKFQYIHGGI